MISYSLNFEDVILMRALGSNRNGFYIDVGASWPDVHSVTKAFYDIGWRGINVEPLPEPYGRLVADRSRDVNVRCALGDSSGSTQIWVPEVDGWATVRPDIIENLKADGHRGSYHEVPLRTLRDVCEQYAEDVIHFLKIDVEGYEREVLRGADFRKFRPWVVLVEATYPGTPREVYEAWEDLLLEVDYRLAYVDGLNRFYVASEKSDLMPAFRYPPNVFDNFKLFNQHRMEMRAAELEAIVRHQEETAIRAAEETARMRQDMTRLQGAVEDLEMLLSQEKSFPDGYPRDGELLEAVKRIEEEKKALSIKLARATIEIESYRSRLQMTTDKLDRLNSSAIGNLLFTSVSAIGTVCEVIREKSDSLLQAVTRWYRKKVYPGTFLSGSEPTSPDWLQSQPRRTKELFTALKHSPMRGNRDKSHSH